ncbi:branched-chain amino acid ABC transporter permease [Kibdelosporangium philippinense]|uniref:Branched-chain amino acid ABC transporter permease n=1 Tax=Kibdelosporangium philippinense TaxID=211113 RepID=A0ABS8Z6M4_9PSEU|nr:branched-chain amino acid ABC transporter permease [Kibdelosporangium philippinense]MCE7002291.1 branched-chain amino acid ABC transporter permease [Kibdelosporangium philippinense]
MAELFTGLATGMTYALVGLGIALIFQVTGVINFAQGDFVMVSGLVFATLRANGFSTPLAVVIAVASTTAIGALTHLLVIAPAHRAGHDRLMILTIGVSIVLQGAALLVFGADARFAPEFSAGEPLRLLGVAVPRQYLWCAGVTVVLVVLLWLFLTRTVTGTAMRASAMDPGAAQLTGISPKRMGLLVFSLAAALAAAAGSVLAPLQPPDATIGVALGLKGFTAAVIGGLSSPAGAAAGGLVIGLVEAYATGYLSSEYKDTLTYGLLLVVLLVRPGGLLRRRAEVSRV